MEDGKYVPGSIWIYAPNKGAPVFFATAFALSAGWHTYQCIRFKCWKLTGLYVFCTIVFTAGFITREIGAFDYGNLIKYIVSICLVYAAPPVFELGNYLVLGRILYYVPYLSPIHPGRVLTTFTAISGIVEALNGNGASYSANQSLPQSKQDMGRALLKAALIMQLAVVGLFLLLAVVFHRRCARAGLATAKLNSAMATLYASSGLLTARTIFRTVEYFEIAQLHIVPGFDPSSMSPILRYECFFYIFEASLMLANTLLINIRHPRHYLPASTKIYLAHDGVTEVEGPGYKEERNFIMTIIDPFDIVGLIQGRDKKTNFWDEPATKGSGAEETPEPKKKDAPLRTEDPEAA